MPDTSLKESRRKGLAFSSQSLAQDSGAGCSDSPGGTEVCSVVRAHSWCWRKMSAFLYETEVLWIPGFPFQGSFFPQRQPSHSWPFSGFRKTFAGINMLSFVHNIHFKEILLWTSVICVVFSCHDVLLVTSQCI